MYGTTLPPADASTHAEETLALLVTRIEELFADSRVLEAAELLQKAEPIFEQQNGGSHTLQKCNTRFLALADIIRQRQSEINTAHSRMESHEGWALLREDKHHTKSYCRFGRDPLTRKQLIYVKVDAVINGAGLFDCAAIWKEGPLFKTWLPLCHTSEILAQFTETNLLLKLGIGPAVLGREIVLDCYGDQSHIETNNSFTLVTKSVVGGKQLENNGIKFEVPQESWARPRANVRYLEVLVQALPPPSPVDGSSDGNTACGDIGGRGGGVRNCAVMCLDPGYEVPMWLFERIMKPGASAFLGYVAEQAQALAKANAVADSMAVRTASASAAVSEEEKDKVANARKMSRHWDTVRKNAWYAEQKQRLTGVPACSLFITPQQDVPEQQGRASRM
jgi:hypothetical protein